MTRIVEISAEGVAGVRADLVATRDALEGLGPLRSRASALGVSTTGFDEALGIADRLNTTVLPVVDTHLTRARTLADLRYGGTLGPVIPVVDDDPDPLTQVPAYTQTALATGGTVLTWGPEPAEDQEADQADTEKSQGIGGWFSDRWDDVTDAVDEGTDWVASTASDAWESVTDAGAAISDWWESTTADLGGWIDQNLAGLRDWIGEHVGLFRFLASACRVIGWILVVVGLILTVALAIIGAMGGAAIGAVFGFGVGAVPGGAAGAAAGAAFGLKILGVGFTLVSVGDFLDVVADWGEGKIDGQDLVKQGTLELALAITSLIGVGIVGKILQKTFKHLPASWRSWLEDLLKKKPQDNRTWRGSGTADDPVVFEYSNPAEAFRTRAEPTRADLDGLGPHTDYPAGSEEHMLARWQLYQTNGSNRLTWEQWRDQYIRNQGNKPRGDAFENAVYELDEYSPDEWTRNTSVKDASGVDRNYDVVNIEDQIGVEIKSGNTIDPAQLAKDQTLVNANWTIRYVFGSQPSAATIRKLDEAGIEWRVVHSEAVVR
ncbi:hypothetical protein [Cellulomonas terrae]|uniref:Uncharacterized protein n=1 Tax=Cellulomonas terrae TaxID=311234 RepID=A0A511JMT4_9CELL|nr:hypothetical protein [Cellulomonas terrae]GEL99239.1 hypothetical protein CTE05_27860 [Cellulomonas terrae]